MLTEMHRRHRDTVEYGPNHQLFDEIPMEYFTHNFDELCAVN